MAPTNVVVSGYFVDSTIVVIYVSRVFGLMPFKYYKSEVQNRFQFSKWFAFYGIVMVITLSCVTLAGFMIDLKFGKNRLENSLYKYVTMVEIATVQFFLLTSCITFIMERTAFLKMAYHLTQIDQILDLRDASEARKQSIYSLSIVAALITLLLAYIHYVWIEVSQIELYTISYSLGYYICYVVLLALLVLYWVLSDCITRRLIALQEGLTFNRHHLNKKGEPLTSAHIMNMIFVYENAYLALDAFSTAIGPIIFAELTNVVIVMVSNACLVIQQGVGNYNIQLRTIEWLWGAFNIARLIAIVEPAHRLNDGMRTVRMLVSELLSVDVDKDIKLQLDTFATHLLITPPGSFTPFGMINVTRGVILTMAGTVTTYVVLVLNLHKG